MRLLMYKHLLMSSKTREKIEKEMREKLEKELKDKNKELKKKIKNLTNNQITNNFGKIIMKN